MVPQGPDTACFIQYLDITALENSLTGGGVFAARAATLILTAAGAMKQRYQRWREEKIGRLLRYQSENGSRPGSEGITCYSSCIQNKV